MKYAIAATLAVITLASVAHLSLREPEDTMPLAVLRDDCAKNKRDVDFCKRLDLRLAVYTAQHRNHH